jgi:large subunit ribosomal protein L32
MPLPKRRHSNTRTRLRRTHYKLTTLPTLSECPRCHSPRQAHHACPSCGFYNGRPVLTIRKKHTTA